MSRSSLEPEDLQVLGVRLARWRRAHGGPGRRIPEDLWGEAATLARLHGVDVVADGLRLSRSGLIRRIGTTPVEADARPTKELTFVEVALTGGLSVEEMVVVVVEGPRGEQLRIRARSAQAEAVASAVQGFLSGLESPCSR